MAERWKDGSAMSRERKSHYEKRYCVFEQNVNRLLCVWTRFGSTMRRRNRRPM